MTLTDLLGNNEDAAWMLTPGRPCATGNADDWFPSNGGTIEQAGTLCRGCPVINQCAGYALADPTLEGIWGATTQLVRARIRNGAAA